MQHNTLPIRVIARKRLTCPVNNVNNDDIYPVTKNLFTWPKNGKVVSFYSLLMHPLLSSYCNHYWNMAAFFLKTKKHRGVLCSIEAIGYLHWSQWTLPWIASFFMGKQRTEETKLETCEKLFRVNVTLTILMVLWPMLCCSNCWEKLFFAVSIQLKNHVWYIVTCMI